MIFSKKFSFIKLASLSLVSVLFVVLTQTKASADVNVNVLNSVIKSCQDSPPQDNLLFKVNYSQLDPCVRSRYYYSIFSSKFNALKNLGDLRPGFPASVLLAAMATNQVYNIIITSEMLLDCMVSRNSNSRECSPIAQYLSTISFNYGRTGEAMLICSSCFNAYNTGSTWQQSMSDDLITWFYGLDKPNRKLVVDIFSDRQFINSLVTESEEARQLYLKIKDKVEREEQERKRRELLQ